MDSKALEGRVRLITDGGVRVTLRRATLSEGVTAEIDAFIPLSAIMSLDLSGTLAVREDWVVENLGAGILGPQPTLNAPKAGPVTLEHSPAWRKLLLYVHPDTAGRSVIPATEMMAALNQFAAELKHESV